MKELEYIAFLTVALLTQPKYTDRFTTIHIYKDHMKNVFFYFMSHVQICI